MTLIKNYYDNKKDIHTVKVLTKLERNACHHVWRQRVIVPYNWQSVCEKCGLCGKGIKY